MTDYSAPMPPPQQYAPYGYAPPQKSHGGLAVSALVLGIVGLVFSVIPGVCWFIGYPCDVLAVIFGAIAFKGWSKAKAGLILGVLGLVAATAWTIAVANAVHTVTHELDQYNRCTNNTPPQQWDRCDKYLN